MNTNPEPTWIPSQEILQSYLDNALAALKATVKAFNEAIALYGDNTDETLDHYTALGGAVHDLHREMQQCIDLGYSVLLQTETEVHPVRTLGKNIFNADLIKFSRTKDSEFVFEGVSLRYVQSVTVELSD